MGDELAYPPSVFLGRSRPLDVQACDDIRQVICLRRLAEEMVFGRVWSMALEIVAAARRVGEQAQEVELVAC